MLRGNCHLLHFVCCRKPATTKVTGSESSKRAMLQGASELLDELNVPPPPKRPNPASSSRSSSLLAELHSVSSRDQSTLPSTRSLSPTQCEDQECSVPAACDIVTTSGTANPALLAPSSPAPQQSTASTPVVPSLGTSVPGMQRTGMTGLLCVHLHITCCVYVQCPR